MNLNTLFLALITILLFTAVVFLGFGMRVTIDSAEYLKDNNTRIAKDFEKRIIELERVIK